MNATTSKYKGEMNNDVEIIIIFRLCKVIFILGILEGQPCTKDSVHSDATKCRHIGSGSDAGKGE
jgi:hypothetical protein